MPKTFESLVVDLSRQAMMLTLALRRGEISESAYQRLEREVEKYWDEDRSIAEAWAAFERVEGRLPTRR